MSQRNKLYGLVLCGGKSSRMGFDKGELTFYNNKKHKYFLYELLEELCDEVFISCKESQKDSIAAEYKTLTDLPEYENTGPMSALLSFREKYPDTAVFAIGCDYPFIDRESLDKLIQHRNERAVCYINKSNGNILEPLLTVYEPDFLKIIKENFINENFSLSRILRSENVETIETASELTLLNVNSPKELQKTERLIQKYNFKHKADINIV